MEARDLEHGDIISQLVMERLLLYVSPAEVGSGEKESVEESSDADIMDEGLGGSDPSSLGSLSLSFPQQMSLSSSTAGSGMRFTTEM